MGRMERKILYQNLVLYNWKIDYLIEYKIFKI